MFVIIIQYSIFLCQVTFGGYNHKQVVLLSKIMDRMTHFIVDPKKFDIFKELLGRKFKNFKAEQPHSHATYYTSIVLDSQAWTVDQAAAGLEGNTIMKTIRLSCTSSVVSRPFECLDSPLGVF